MLRLIAIAAGLILAARALSRRSEAGSWPPDHADRPSEEDVEQELRAS